MRNCSAQLRKGSAGIAECCICACVCESDGGWVVTWFKLFK